jgi:hypothetical protein
VDVQSNNKTGAKTMSINITPLDQQINLKRFEAKFGGSTYDHSARPATGWRAERHMAENRAAAGKNQGENVANDKVPATASNWIASFVNRLVTPRFAG